MGSSFPNFHLIPTEGSKKTVGRSRILWQQLLLLDSKLFVDCSWISSSHNSVWRLSRLYSHHLHSQSLKILSRLKLNYQRLYQIKSPSLRNLVHVAKFLVLFLHTLCDIYAYLCVEVGR